MADSREPPWRRAQQQPRSSFQSRQGNARKRTADEQEDAWVAGEDRFVLKQAKKRAEIRVKEGRAKPIDWLAVTLRFIDNQRSPFDDDIADSDLSVVDPEGVLESLKETELSDLEAEISQFLKMEVDERNRDFWETMKIICEDRRRQLKGGAESGGRGVESVSSDVDKLLAPKSLEELQALEKQIRAKLRSDKDIDVDYWEHLLRSLLSWKARAKLREVSQSIVTSQLQGLRTQQAQEAAALRKELEALQPSVDPEPGPEDTDPEAMLKIAAEDKQLPRSEEQAFVDHVVGERRRILKLGFVPLKQSIGPSDSTQPANLQTEWALQKSDENNQAANALYEREVARGVGENEEVFAGEEDIQSKDVHLWSNKYRPRKPRYFNRVQMGYEWNKYNQTHYDHDNPPPKVVQGYRFNIFYPDLIDKTRAPTYKLERENGRRRGQTQAGAGEEDSCIIRFIAGPPYEDIAFRIVDRDWDYSAKRERGFRSSFEKGILQLHFQFKKIFYRK